MPRVVLFERLVTTLPVLAVKLATFVFSLGIPRSVISFFATAVTAVTWPSASTVTL